MLNSIVRKQLKINGKLSVRNNIFLSPLDINKSSIDGTVSQNDLMFHSSRSKDVGVDVVGSAYVSQTGKTSTHSVSICKDSDVNQLRYLSDAIHQNGSRAFIQLVHAGRMTNSNTNGGLPVIAPSAVKAKHGDFPIPREMTKGDVYQVIQEFTDAVDRAYAAGFDGIELHGANTFLLQQFVSPQSNQRTDMFGGNLYRRLTFVTLLVTKVIEHAKKLSSNFIVGYRLSPEEIEDGGMTLDETVSLAIVLDKLGIDYLSLSISNYAQIPQTVDTEMSIVSIFEKFVKCQIVVAGGIKTKQDIIEAGHKADFLAVGMALINDPDWLKKVGD